MLSTLFGKVMDVMGHPEKAKDWISLTVLERDTWAQWGQAPLRPFANLNY